MCGWLYVLVNGKIDETPGSTDVGVGRCRWQACVSVSAYRRALSRPTRLSVCRRAALLNTVSIITISQHYSHFHCTHVGIHLHDDRINKKHLKNVGPIRHCEPLHAACFTLPFTRCRYCRTPPLSHAACSSISTTTTTTTTTRDRGDRYGPMEWVQSGE